MKIRCVSILVLLLNISLFFGQGDSGDVYSGELQKLVTIPDSPEAAAFKKYGNDQVNLYAGIPLKSIPIGQLTGLEFSIPLNLTYDFSGIKVDQIATSAGLGWNLNVGGRITRVVNGFADDYISGNYQTVNSQDVVSSIKKAKAYDNLSGGRFPDMQSAQDYVSFLEKISENTIDAQPDYFVLSAPGLAGTIIVDYNDQYASRVLNNPRISVQSSYDSDFGILSWTVINEDGTQYFFNLSEKTQRMGDDAGGNTNINSTYASSWVLTKIISSNGKDVFDFNYSNTGFWQQEQFLAASETLQIELHQNVDHYPYITGQLGLGSYKIDQQLLTSVYHNSKQVLGVGYGSRFDVVDNPLDSRIVDLVFFNSNGEKIRSVDFLNDDYFGLSGQQPNVSNKNEIRLKLNGLRFNDSDETEVETYAFEYHNPVAVPERGSNAQDLWGYYNGANNTTLIPAYEYGSWTFAGADRAPNHDFAKIGMLTKITYPTKGSTEYEFEAHDEFRSETQEVTHNYLSLRLDSGNTNYNEDLIKDENGVFCEDPLIQPVVKIKSFTIQDPGRYTVTYRGNSNSEVIIGDQSRSYNTYCDFLGGADIYIRNSVSGRVVESVRLDNPGTYYVVLVNSSPSGNYGLTSVDITKIVESQVGENVEIGGLRIKSISDRTATGALASKREYSYRSSNGRSTAKINFAPTFAQFQVTSESNFSLIRRGSVSRGDEPYVVYPFVKEIISSTQGGSSSGQTQYTYYDLKKGAVPRKDAPYENNYFASLKGGQPQMINLFDNTLKQVSKKEFDYFETIAPNALRGYVTAASPTNVRQYAFLREHNIGNAAEYYVSYEFRDQWECTNDVSSPSANGALCSTPAWLTNPQLLCDGEPNCSYTQISNDFANIRGRYSFAQGVYGGISSNRESTYFSNGSSPTAVFTEHSTSYDPIIDYLPRTTKTIDSKGNEWETTITYPKDDDVLGSDNLVAKNNFAVPLKTVSTLKRPDSSSNEVISTAETRYALVGQQNGAAVVLPTEVITKKGQRSDDSRGSFTYYANGNLKSSKKADGPETVYVWGYDDRYPIAKVEHATFAQVSPYIFNLKTPSDNDDDRTIGEIGNEGNLRTALQNLRNSLDNAMVTTYTYDPLVGVTSMTDPRGYTIYYEYDEYNRLKAVKDDDGNLVTDYEYGYKQPVLE